MKEPYQIQENQTNGGEYSDKEFYSEVIEHAETTTNANNWTFFLTILGCIAVVGFGIVEFLESGRLILLGLSTGFSIVAVSAAFLLRAFVQNSIHATELLVMIASLNEHS